MQGHHRDGNSGRRLCYMCFLSGVTWHPPADPQGANSGWSGLGNLSSNHMRETTEALRGEV